MDLKTWILIIAVILSFALGYLASRKFRKNDGDIVYELYSEEEGEHAVRCTFKLDLDVDDIVKKDEILLGVIKSQEVLDYYKKIESNGNQ